MSEPKEVFNAKPLKLFVLHDNRDIENQVNVAIWCRTERYARRKMAVSYYRESGDWPDEKERASWHFSERTNAVPEGLAKSKVCMESRDKVLRSIGWHKEGDDQCECCLLYSWSGEYPVCEECERCSECGHADDCENNTGEESLPWTN